jgi:hypothetical protein
MQQGWDLSVSNQNFRFGGLIRMVPTPNRAACGLFFRSRILRARFSAVSGLVLSLPRTATAVCRMTCMPRRARVAHWNWKDVQPPRSPDRRLVIRIDAKRQALDALDAARRSTAHNGDGNGDGANQTEIPAIVEVGDDLT